MGSTQLCEICLQAAATKKCRLCGRSVCEKHFDERRGVCIACVETLCEVCGTRLSVGYCAVCGRLVCDSCSVEEGLALVCVDCARKLLKHT
uniref:B box-type domain-containing protein n=1 Tax=Thermofilum pendens TaxID=2269 RepID=A0A7C1T5K9_THEPE